MSLRTSLILVVSVLAVSCDNHTSPPRAMKSPDGTLTLSWSVNDSQANPTRYLCVVVDITDSAGKTLHHEVTPVSDRIRWSPQWVSNDEVMLKSSGVGVYRIRRLPDGTWKGQLGAS